MSSGLGSGSYLRFLGRLLALRGVRFVAPLRVLLALFVLGLLTLPFAEPLIGVSWVAVGGSTASDISVPLDSVCSTALPSPSCGGFGGLFFFGLAPGAGAFAARRSNSNCFFSSSSFSIRPNTTCC
jgi:hypothetical protein